MCKKVPLYDLSPSQSQGETFVRIKKIIYILKHLDQYLHWGPPKDSTYRRKAYFGNVPEIGHVQDRNPTVFYDITVVFYMSKNYYLCVNQQ